MLVSLYLFPILLLFTSFLASAASFRGVVCRGDLPQWHNAYPEHLGPGLYSDLADLCAASYDPLTPNVGGICTYGSDTPEPSIGADGPIERAFGTSRTFDQDSPHSNFVAFEPQFSDTEAGGLGTSAYRLLDASDDSSSDSDNDSDSDKDFDSDNHSDLDLGEQMDVRRPSHLSFPQRFASREYRGLMQNDRARAIRWYCWANCWCKGWPRRKPQHGQLIQVNSHTMLEYSQDHLVLIRYLPAHQSQSGFSQPRQERQTLVPIPDRNRKGNGMTVLDPRSHKDSKNFNDQQTRRRPQRIDGRPYRDSRSSLARPFARRRNRQACEESQTCTPRYWCVLDQDVVQRVLKGVETTLWTGVACEVASVATRYSIKHHFRPRRRGNSNSRRRSAE